MLSTNSIIFLLLGLIVSHEIGFINSKNCVLSTAHSFCYPFQMRSGCDVGGWFFSLLFYLVDFIHYALHLHLVLIIIIQLKMLHNFPFSVICLFWVKLMSFFFSWPATKIELPPARNNQKKTGLTVFLAQTSSQQYYIYE